MRITVVDENHAITHAAYRVLLPAGVKTSFASSLDELSLVFENTGPPDLLVVNVWGGVTSWGVAGRLRRAGFRGRVLAFVDSVSGPGVRCLVELSQAECVVRPSTDQAIDELLRKAVPPEVLAPSTATPSADRAPGTYHGLVGQSPAMRDVFVRMEKAASTDANVCVYGESGTGKELIARAIHHLSARRTKPLVTLDCTTIPEGLMESHLLGHVRGAFTGAVDHREGVFSLAHTGTLFIDELGELTLPLQAKLLRVIQTREFIPVGWTKPIKTDVRIVTATNKDLRAEVARGTFREDLYYRVAVLMIAVPPLRERRDDIPPLVEHFLRKFADRYGKSIQAVSSVAMRRIMDLPWTGNVRQLENFLEQAVILTEGDVLTERELFSGEVPAIAAAASATSTSELFEPGLPLREVERRHILRTLQKVRGNRTKAARLLQISVRCLQYKLKEYAQDPVAREEVTL